MSQSNERASKCQFSWGCESAVLDVVFWQWSNCELLRSYIYTCWRAGLLLLLFLGIIADILWRMKPKVTCSHKDISTTRGGIILRYILGRCGSGIQYFKGACCPLIIVLLLLALTLGNTGGGGMISAGVAHLKWNNGERWFRPNSRPD